MNRYDKLPKGARVLIVRLSAIGDVLHVTAVAHNLKRQRPDCHITWLASPPASTLLTQNDDVDRLLVWDRRPFDTAVSNGRIPAALRMLREAAHLLRAEPFDVALDLQGLFLTGILTRMSRAPRRIGIRERHEGNPLFMTEMAPDIEDVHKVRRYMTSLAPLGLEFLRFTPGPILRAGESDVPFARAFYAAHGIEMGRRLHPVVLVAVRTTWADKQWSTAKFAAALAPLPRRIQLVFIGSKGDAPYIEEVRRSLDGRTTHTIAGETDLLQLAALMRCADLLLTCDTGPLYLAEAVHLTTLSLWGPTLPAIYGPLTSGHHFILSPHICRACCRTRCRHKTNACMEAIQPAVVTEKLLAILAEKEAAAEGSR